MDFSSTVHPISWFRDRYRDGSLDMKPPYQRKPVWTAKQKCPLVESILLGLPVPEIYIQQTTSAEGETRYAVVDGQQRIRTILQFIGSETDPEEEEYNKFALDKLESTSPWRNLTFTELSEEDRKRFYAFKLAIRALETESDGEVRDMFKRLNKYLTALNAQELRNATYTGPFVQVVKALADDEYWSQNRIVSPADIRRMKDVQFVSELLIGAMHGPQGGSPKEIDAYYAQYEDYDTEFPDQRRARRLFNQTLDMVKRVLPDIKKESRWSNSSDFYTLFVAFASFLRSNRQVSKSDVPKVRAALELFANEVDDRLADELAHVSQDAIGYVRAVQKRVNARKPRADRHAALLRLIGEYFKLKRSASK